MERFLKAYAGLGANPWGRRGLALLAGFAAALAHPPFGVLPGLLGFAVILRLADRDAARVAELAVVHQSLDLDQ